MVEFVDPIYKTPLKLVDNFLISQSGEHYPIINSIPRFVSGDSYADSFGFQWKQFPQTQLDSITGYKISQNRLNELLGAQNNLKDLKILEIGSGAGRFTEILLNKGAEVYSVDMSMAVEVSRYNIGGNLKHILAQADVNHLPFLPEQFDMVICLGVIQHTKSPKLTISQIYKMAKPGGTIIFDQYKWSVFYFSKPVLFLRLILKRMQPKKSLKFIESLMRYLFPLHWKYKDNTFVTFLLNRISPLYIYITKYPELNYKEHYELTKLDTFDGLTDHYKHLTTKTKMAKILKKLSFENLVIREGGNGIEVIGKKSKINHSENK